MLHTSAMFFLIILILWLIDSANIKFVHKKGWLETLRIMCKNVWHSMYASWRPFWSFFGKRSHSSLSPNLFPVELAWWMNFVIWIDSLGWVLDLAVETSLGHCVPHGNAWAWFPVLVPDSSFLLVHTMGGSSDAGDPATHVGDLGWVPGSPCLCLSLLDI